ncbi:hypothetical protein [Niastella sp. OAS944]|uniref:hypothetical protein n=1 Tax=Niastella sp. OAS944 TaxID=2664089 RepID=UPI003483F9EC|nr:hypothetical protein [Chitinophagaceae bacterium OAS944]
MKTGKNLFLYLLNYCTLNIAIRLSARNTSIASPFYYRKTTGLPRQSATDVSV